MSRPVIQQLPPPPQRGEDFDTFTEKANAHVAALTPWTDNVNDLAEWVNDTAGDVEQNAQSASDAASAASDSSDAAANSAQSASDDADRAESAVAALPEGSIADELVAPDKAWSSQKIDAELADRDATIADKRDLTNTSFPRYDLASAAVTDTLDLAQQQVFRVNASVARTLAFANEPGADRAMTVVVHISGNEAVTWPAGIDWDDEAAPELGDAETKVVLFWDGVEWSGFTRVAK